MLKEAHEMLELSVQRKIKSIYAKSLDEIEKHLPEVISDTRYEVIRNNILNHGNDSLRAFKNEIRSYRIEYKPIERVNNEMKVEKEILDIIMRANFSYFKKPVVKLTSSKKGLLEAIRNEISAGILVYISNENYELVLAGMEIVRVFIPVFSRFYSADNQTYSKWLGQVYDYYLREA